MSRAPKRAIDEGRVDGDAGDEVDRLMRKQVTDGTRDGYLLLQARLVCALHDTHGTAPESVVNGAYFDEEKSRVGGKASVNWVRAKLRLQGYNADQSPLHLARLRARDVAAAVVALNVGRGQALALVTIRSWASAARDLFRSYGVAVPEGYDEEMSRITKGYGKEHVDDRPKNAIGKDALPFEVLCVVNRRMIALGTKDMTFARAFALLQWGLMCRSSNTEQLMLLHMEWRADCLHVYFRKMKNDQDGSRSRDPRSVYANPLKPEVCCFLALGMYLLCAPPSVGQKALFPGSSQATRFNSTLGRVLHEKTLAADLQTMGYANSDFGSHSLRKGSSTFVTSGTTDGPPQMAVNLRAGWTMSKVETTYFRYEKAGDSFVGRCVAGLPIHSADFAILPPMFNETDAAARELVAQALSTCFPHVPDAFVPVCKNLLASVVYHVDWLRNATPRHPVLSTPLFGLDIDALRQLVICKVASPNDDVQATGVPAHVSMKVEIAALRTQQDMLVKTVLGARDDLQLIKAGIQAEVRVGLNDFAADQGQLTRDGVQHIVDVQFAQLAVRFDSLAQQISAIGEPDEVHQVPSRNDAATHSSSAEYSWQGRLHPVPETFVLPVGAVDHAFFHWAVGSKEPPYPPLHTLAPHDMPTINVRKRFSDYRKLMGLIERKAKEAGHWPKDGGQQWKERLSLAEARIAFDSVAEEFELASQTRTGRRRRVSQLAWNTVYKAHCVSSSGSGRKRARTLSRLKPRDPKPEAHESSSCSDAEGNADANDDHDDHDDHGNDDPMAIDQAPEFDVVRGHKLMLQFAAKNHLELICEVPGDGDCFCHAAVVVLPLVRPELAGLMHHQVRRACVDHVFANRMPGTELLLRDLGLRSWAAYRRRMSVPGVYSDSYMVEALAAVYRVRLYIVFAGREASGRYVGGDEGWPEVFMGNVADHHFYPLRRQRRV